MAAFPNTRAALAALLLAGLPFPALANEGGGGGCPWQQELTLTLGAKTLHIPQTAFEGKGELPVIDGYELVPNVEALVLRVTSPTGELWQVALTKLAQKRCVAYYLGKPAMIGTVPVFNGGHRKASVAER